MIATFKCRHNGRGMFTVDERYQIILVPDNHSASFHLEPGSAQGIHQIVLLQIAAKHDSEGARGGVTSSLAHLSVPGDFVSLASRSRQDLGSFAGQLMRLTDSSRIVVYVTDASSSEMAASFTKREAVGNMRRVSRENFSSA